MNIGQIEVLRFLGGIDGDGVVPANMCTNVECLHLIGLHNVVITPLGCQGDKCPCKEFEHDLDKARKNKKLIEKLLQKSSKETPKNNAIDKLGKSSIFCVDTKTAIATFEFFMNEVAHYSSASQKTYRSAWVKFINHCKYGKDAAVKLTD